MEFLSSLENRWRCYSVIGGENQFPLEETQLLLVASLSYFLGKPCLVSVTVNSLDCSQILYKFKSTKLFRSLALLKYFFRG